MSLLQRLNLHPKRNQKNNGDVVYKTFLGDNKLELSQHTRTVKHTRIWIWKTTHQINDIQALTYDYHEQRGEHVRRDLFIIGYRFQDEWGTVVSPPDQRFEERFTKVDRPQAVPLRQAAQTIRGGMATVREIDFVATSDATPFPRTAWATFYPLKHPRRHAPSVPHPWRWDVRGPEVFLDALSRLRTYRSPRAWPPWQPA